MHSTTSISGCDSTRPSRRLMGSVLLLCCLSTSGCSLLADTHHVLYLAKRTTKLEPEQFPYIKNDKLTRRRDLRLAKRAWAEVAGTSDSAGFSKHHARGFVTGFADYLYRGGAGDAPLVPPRDYWRLGYQSPNGQQAVDDWYDGFRHGVDECRLRGYRDLVVVRSSLIGSYNMPYSDVRQPTGTPVWSSTADGIPPATPTATSAVPISNDVPHPWKPVRPDEVIGQGTQVAPIPRVQSRLLRKRLRRSSVDAVGTNSP